jgi:hypothetical protein
MGDPRRWLDDGGGSRAAVDLLRTVDPPKEPPAAVRAALGRRLAGLVAASGARAAAGIGWAKITLLSVAVAGTGAGAVWTLSHRSPVRASSPTSSELATGTAEEPAPAATAGPTAENVLPAPPLDAPSARPADRQRAPSPEPRDRLAEEEALLEEARKTLSQDPARALTLLRRHQTRFAHGELTAERMYLSVDCLSRLGKRDAARREADALIERYPDSAYARRAPLLLTAPGR